MDIYDYELTAASSPIPFEIVETDIDLYYHIAFTMYTEIEKNNAAGKPTVFILPVGPVFQYRRFISLCRKRRLDLSNLYCFFMDEYLNKDRKLIDIGHPLSFRGFIHREFILAMPPEMKLSDENVLFPDPDNPSDYDRRLSELGEAEVCFAGVGINGHLAFNEPPDKEKPLSNAEFKALPSRVVRLTRETITINSNTALKGAYERIPEYAVTVGFKRILRSKKIIIYLNRPWQSSVLRKLLFGEKTAFFPASLVRDHADARLVLTQTVAAKPEFQLK